jgi:hypothetical protein
MDWRVGGRLVLRAGVDGRLQTFKQRGRGEQGEGRRGRSRGAGISARQLGQTREGVQADGAIADVCGRGLQQTMDYGGHSTLRCGFLLAMCVWLRELD